MKLELQNSNNIVTIRNKRDINDTKILSTYKIQWWTNRLIIKRNGKEIIREEIKVIIETQIVALIL